MSKEKRCSTCKNAETYGGEWPCNSCVNQHFERPYWCPKGEIDMRRRKPNACHDCNHIDRPVGKYPCHMCSVYVTDSKVKTKNFLINKPKECCKPKKKEFLDREELRVGAVYDIYSEKSSHGIVYLGEDPNNRGEFCFAGIIRSSRKLYVSTLTYDYWNFKLPEDE